MRFRQIAVVATSHPLREWRRSAMSCRWRFFSEADVGRGRSPASSIRLAMSETGTTLFDVSSINAVDGIQWTPLLGWRVKRH